tara:strand:- start:20824 stop:21144 length:321 start_codon:yes stop_codon:yes gene_type:complete
MKTNVPIELSDSQRDRFANWLDTKETKRLATRADVNEFLQGVIAGVLDQSESTKPNQPEPVRPPATASHHHPHKALIEKTIAERGMSAAQAKGYWRGWTMQPFKKG